MLNRDPKNKNVLCRLLAFMMLAAIFSQSLVFSASAETATFTTPVTGNPGDVVGAANNSGVLIGNGETLGLLLANSFGVLSADGSQSLRDVSIFVLTSAGVADGTIRFGRFNNGAPTFFHTQGFSTSLTGNQIDFNFLGFVGCGTLGCDFIQITTNGANNGANGVIFDAATFNNVAISNFVSSAPEPSVWAMILMGFFMVAWQMKRNRRAIMRSIAKNMSPQPLNAFSLTYS